ncbi:protein lplB [Candidatus Epulonipiscium fishelsonii]|uniref:Protein lplB n=1 Tax=Candidatus Epulonipiscium fishelsonii TaxID=77094 RepID=A0ACC8XG07_9FIRM|nr:protein lplB [Epulopiscium sp. SCG-B05WGA-EpuloA1]ONI42251.1 protein lplB [Epulopiscium sp. SCG-B11WGA-EpuloA1]
MKKRLSRFKREKEFWLISTFALVWLAIFAYSPMYGLSMAFFEYSPGKSFINDNFVGFKYFIQFFESPEFSMVMRNTLAISLLNLAIGFPMPIIFAICLNEIRNKFSKRFFQTVSYVPHFISWVVVASFMFSLMGTEGLFNQLLQDFGFIDKPIGFLSEGKYFWGNIVMANIWKGLGWSAIIYLSAIAGIDDTYYEAGAIDGLGRFGLIWHITLPFIRPTILVLFILSMGGLLNAGFEQQLLLGNDLTREYHEVIDTYTYRYGLQLGKYSYATAVGLMKSVISVIMVFGANYLGKKLFDTSIL